MDCVYISSQKGITIKYTSPCFDEKYQTFIDNFLKKILDSLTRIDSSKEILVLVNFEQLYFDDSKTANFISVGYDSLKEMNSNFIIRYFYDNFNTSAENRLNPININFTDKKEASKMGIKIVYNHDYRLGPPIWSEIEKLIIFSVINFETIKTTQRADTVRHYSSYVTLPTIDSFAINKILGKQEVLKETKLKSTRDVSNFWLLALICLTSSLFITELVKKHNS